jgi:transcriptional regulator with XRE-family HTH domain
MKIETRFGKFMQWHRKKKRMSLNTLSKKIYGSVSHVGYLSEIEKGNRSIKITTAFKILEALDLDLRLAFNY